MMSGGIGYTSCSARSYEMIIVSLADKAGKRAFIASQEMDFLSEELNTCAVFAGQTPYTLTEDMDGATLEALRDIFDKIEEPVYIAEDEAWLPEFDEIISRALGIRSERCDIKNEALAVLLREYLILEGLDVNNIKSASLSVIINCTLGDECERTTFLSEFPECPRALEEGADDEECAALYGTDSDTIRYYRDYVLESDEQDDVLAEITVTVDIETGEREKFFSIRPIG